MFQLPTRFTRSPWFMTTWWRFLQYNWWEEKEGILLLFGEVFVESFSLDLSEWKWMDFPKISPMSLLGYVVKSGYKSILHKKQQPSLWMWKMIDVGFNSNHLQLYVEPTMAFFIIKESGYFNLTRFEQRIANKLLIHPRCIWNLLAHFVMAIKLRPLHIV